MSGGPNSDRELAEERAHIGRMAMLQVGALLLAILEEEEAFSSRGVDLPKHLETMRKRLFGSDIEVVAVQKEHRFVSHANSKVTVHIGQSEAEYIRLTSVVGQSYVAGNLRSDGVIENESFGTLLPTSAIQNKANASAETSLKGDPNTDHSASSGSFGVGDFLRTIVNRSSPGNAVQLLGIELYRGGAIVNYQVSPTQPGDIDAMTDIELRDDLGTEYGLAAYVKSGVESYHCAAEFTPAVPSSASNLEVTVGRAKWKLDLN
jgi:hypothetical protein